MAADLTTFKGHFQSAFDVYILAAVKVMRLFNHNKTLFIDIKKT